MLLRMTSSALALLALSAPAMAAVTPEQVWQDWLNYFESAGYEVTEGSRELAGATLTVRDVAFSAGDTDTRINFTVPEVTMQETGDGGVRTVYTDQQDLQVLGSDPEGGAFDLKLHMSFPGNEMISSGEPGNMTHTYDYPELTISVQTITTDEKTLELPITFALAGNTGQLSHSGTDEASEWTLTHKSESLTARADIDQPEVRFSLDATLDGLETQGIQRGKLPGNADEDSIAAALDAGLAMQASGVLGAMKASFSFTDLSQEEPGDEVQGTMTAGPLEVSYDLSRDGLGYQLGSSNLDVELNMAPLPFPVRYGLESSILDLLVPLSKSDEAQPFKLAYSLAGLQLSDQIWDMFDPARTLNRDPANIDLDITGQTRLTRNLLDTSALDDATGNPMDMAAENNPFDPVEVTLNQFGLNAVGARIEASGALRPSAEHGMDQPIGNLKVNFSGVAELIQALAQMGLLPPEQVMAANAMIGMFTVEDANTPGARAAELVMDEDGSIFANGVQLQ